MENLKNKMSRKSVPEKVRRITETIFACKWSFTILTVVQNGTVRPGAICRCIEGLSPKVMNHCLGKLVDFSILQKKAYPEIPPRVEYLFTAFGLRFMGIFDLLDELSHELAEDEPGP